MMKIMKRWIDRIFQEEETLVLLLLITVVATLLVWLGSVLAPVIAALVAAFVMQGLIAQMVKAKVPQGVATTLAFLLFISFFFGVLLVLMPLVWQQLTALVQEAPELLAQLKAALLVLPERYEIITSQQVNDLIKYASNELQRFGQQIVSFSIAQLFNIVTVLIYLIIIPLLVFFFLKDKNTILSWMAGFLPARRPVMNRVWEEMNDQVANYVRGKFIEIVIVGVATYVAFAWLGINYAALLALLVGLSVVIPYIGAAAVTLPVAMVAFLQWGWSGDFLTLMAVYLIIQGLDGNVLVPLLFSEAVNMHPVAIILAVLMFGGIWGLWGVFFAIPLATLIKAIINAWPKPRDIDQELQMMDEEAVTE